MFHLDFETLWGEGGGVEEEVGVCVHMLLTPSHLNKKNKTDYLTC